MSDKPKAPRSEAERKALATWQARYEQAKAARQPFEPQWRLNLAFVLGNQWVERTLDGTLRSVMRGDEPWRVYHVDNRVLAAVRKDLGRLVRSKPYFDVLPDGLGQAELAAAKAGQETLDALWLQLALSRLAKRVGWFAVIMGSGFAFVGWDDTAAGGQGEVAVAPLSPFEVLPDPGAEDLDASCQWVIVEKVRSADYVAEHYGQRVQGTDRRVVQLAPGVLVPGELGVGQAVVLKDAVVIREGWQVPTKARPEGWRFVWTDGEVLLTEPDEPHPFEDRQLPLAKADYIHVTGRFWGEPLVTHLIPAQRELNKTKSQAMEHRNLEKNPGWLAPKGMLSSVTDEPGAIIEFEPFGTLKPEKLTPQPMPTTYDRIVQMCLDSIMDIAAQREFTRGGPIPSRTPGVVVLQMQQADAESLGPTVDEFDAFFERTGTLILSRSHQFYRHRRYLALLGKNREWQIRALKGADLPRNPRVKVRAGSALGLTKLAQQATLLQLADRGYLSQATVLKFLDLGDLDPVLEELQLDSQEAQAEHERLAAADVPVEWWQNHQVHLFEHTRFLKTAEGKALSPTARARFEQHVRAHHLALQPVAPAAAPAAAAPAPGARGVQGAAGAGPAPGGADLEDQVLALVQELMATPGAAAPGAGAEG